MLPIEKRMIKRRFINLILLNSIISFSLTVMNVLDILKTRNQLSLGIFIGAVIFYAVTLWRLKRCYYDIRNKKVYYFINIVSYSLFALFGYLIYFLGFEQLYTFLYATTKIIRFTAFSPPIPVSALLFHAIGFAMVFVAPIGMGWAFKSRSGKTIKKVYSKRKK